MTEAMFRVLIVEDDAAIRAVVRTLLQSQGCRIIEAESAERGLIEARSAKPDLIIVDLGLPDRDGHSLILAIRKSSTVPILVLSARAEEREKIAALDAGADDYVTKPFSAPELLARVRAGLRRSSHTSASPPRLHFGSIEIDLAARTSGDAHLTPLEFRLIERLAQSPGMIVTQKELIRHVWGPGRQDDARGLRSFIKQLRQKLEPDPHRPRYLITETGVGYRLLLEPAGG